MKKFKGKKILWIILAGVIFLTGVSYAWLTINLTGTKRVVIRSGNLSLNLDETSKEGINLINSYPMTDQEGMKTTSYDFTLKNDGTVSSNYVVSIDDVTETEKKLDLNILKYDLKKTLYNKDGSEKTSQTDTMQLLSSIKTDDGITLDSGILEEGEYITYELKIWIDYDAGNEYQDSAFNGVLKIDGTQIIE